MSAFSVCAWLRKTTTDAFRYWFSYAVPGSDNEIIIGEDDAGTVVFYIQNSRIGTDGNAWPVNAWTHVCVSWDSSSRGFIAVNGEVVESENGFKAGASIRAGGTLVLGQDQDNVGGGFDASQSYQGDIYDLNLWEYALSEDEVSFLYSSGRCGFAEIDHDPEMSYSDVYGQRPQGDAQFVDGSCADPDQSQSMGKVLRFPPQSEVSTSNYVQLTADFGVNALRSLSVCTWYFKSFSDSGRFVFSYAISGDDNAIILGEWSDHFVFYVRRARFDTDIVLEQQTWYHICATWSSRSGMVVYVDGENRGEADLALGASVPSGGILTLGQEQDSLGGGFDRNQAFAGSIYNMNIFNVQLSARQVAEVYSEGTFCAEVPDDFFTDEQVAVSYDRISSIAPSGDAVFESGNAAWRHGAMNCANEDIDHEVHNPDCWKVMEGRRFNGRENAGELDAMDLVTAQSVCYASSDCVALTCEEAVDGVLCTMQSSLRRTRKSSRHTSYKFVC